jgi:hypothetical protein
MLVHLLSTCVLLLHIYHIQFINSTGCICTVYVSNNQQRHLMKNAFFFHFCLSSTQFNYTATYSISYPYIYIYYYMEMYVCNFLAFVDHAPVFHVHEGYSSDVSRYVMTSNVAEYRPSVQVFSLLITVRMVGTVIIIY